MFRKTELGNDLIIGIVTIDLFSTVSNNSNEWKILIHSMINKLVFDYLVLNYKRYFFKNLRTNFELLKIITKQS